MSTKEFIPTDSRPDRLGAHSLHLPAEPQRLRHALELLGKVSDDLERSRAALDDAAGDGDVRGDTAHSLQRVVRFSRFTARRDRRMLDELADVVQQLVDVVGEVQGSEMEQLRSRWTTARHTFIASAKEGDHKHPGQLANAIDADVSEEFRPMFRRLHGSVPGDGEHHAMALESSLDGEAKVYRREVRQVLEEFQDRVQRVRRAERAVRENLSWEPRDRQPEDTTAGGGKDAEKDSSGISGPRVIRRLRQALDDGADVLEQIVPQLGPIARSINDGMLPNHGDAEDTDRRDFRVDWEQHIERRIKRMRFVSKTSEKMAAALARLDEETANEIFKDQDDD